VTVIGPSEMCFSGPVATGPAPLADECGWGASGRGWVAPWRGTPSPFCPWSSRSSRLLRGTGKACVWIGGSAGYTDGRSASACLALC
jgi:hypothetical protein